MAKRKPHNVCATRAEARERMKNIAADMASGVEMKAVVQKYGVSREFVEVAMRKHGVKHVAAAKRRAEREAQHKRIIEALVKGEGTREVAKREGVTRTTVSQVGRAAGLSIAKIHLEAALADVNPDCDLDAVAAKHGYSAFYLRNQATKRGVRFPTVKRGPKPGTPAFQILAVILNSTKPYVDIAAEFGVSRQRVDQVRAAAEQQGIAIPKRRSVKGIHIRGKR